MNGGTMESLCELTGDNRQAESGWVGACPREGLTPPF